jgi:V8-like Glu-specific endopeptidase
VFFTLDGGDFVCSASSVHSANRDTVVTAGHCVNSGPGEFATRWAFVPGYHDGYRPYGTWTARRLFAPTAWTERGNIDYDVGFAAVDRNDGRHLADAVGSQDIAFGSSRGQYAYAFGYPAVGRYDGNSLLYCQGTATDDSYGTDDQGMTCDMTDGSSGGPWLSRFDPKSGRGVLTSVNSFGYNGMPNVMWGPYFGDEIHSVFGTAQHS